MSTVSSPTSSARSVISAALFLVAALAFAYWTQARKPQSARVPGAIVSDVRSTSSAPHARRAVELDARGERHYSIGDEPCVLTGSVRDATGAPLAPTSEKLDAIELVHANGRRVLVPVDMTGFFGASGLEAGTWTATLERAGFWRDGRATTIDASKPGELALVAETLPALALTMNSRVHGDGGDGRVLRRQAWLDSARIVATLERPDDVLNGAVVSQQACSTLFARMRDDVAAGVRTQLFDGPLELHGPSPMWISFVIGRSVIASKRIERGERTIAFELEPKDLDRGLGGLLALGGTEPPFAPCELRYAPLERALAAGDAWQRVFTFAPSSSMGARVDDLPFGDYVLQVGGEGSEIVHAIVTVTGGRVSVAGRYRLERERRIGGIVRGGVRRLECAPLERASDVLAVFERRGANVDTDGRFVFTGLGKRVYVVRSADDRATFAPMVVDASSDDALSLAIDAKPGVRIALTRTAGFRRGDRAKLVDARGVVAWERVAGWDEPGFTTRVASGRYELRVAVADRAIEPRTLDVVASDVRVDLDAR